MWWTFAIQAAFLNTPSHRLNSFPHYKFYILIKEHFFFQVIFPLLDCRHVILIPPVSCVCASQNLDPKLSYLGKKQGLRLPFGRCRSG